jgi:hypothetical protein
MSVDNEFEIEIRINGLRGKRPEESVTSRKMRIYREMDYVCVKLWRCEMSVDNEFEIEIRINGLRGKRPEESVTSRKMRIYRNQSNCLFICVCLVCVDEFVMI